LPDDAEAAQRIAAARRTNPAALRQALRGDIAIAVGKAIKADPAERYRSVPDFADDLQRTLEQRPIAARPDSLAYRSARFVRRHRFGVGAAALIVIAIAAGVTGTLIKAREAERQAERAVAVKRFLLDLFEQARGAVKSNGTQAREATIGDILNAGAERVDRAFASQPEIRDEVFGVLTDLYSETNDRARITDLARRRLAAARTSFGAEDRRVAPAEVLLGGVLVSYGEFEEAKKLLDHTQAVLDRAGDDSSEQRAHLLRWQGAYLQFTDPKAPWPEHPLRRAVRLMRERYPNDDYLLEALMGVPGIACKAGYVDEALAAADELQTRALARYGPDTLFTVEAMVARGNLLMLAGRSDEAIPLLEGAAKGFAKFTGDSNDVIWAELALAQAHYGAGHVEEAERLAEAAALRIARDHPNEPRLADRLRRYHAATEKIRTGNRPHCGG
jgi:serine/threonine-protein kinase